MTKTIKQHLIASGFAFAQALALLALALTLASTLSSHAGQAAEQHFPWPNGARAAINLAYDDALDSQLDKALPALNQYGLKGSFYLTLGADTVRQRLADWRKAAADGHELGNHTLFHQCSGSIPGRDWLHPDNDLDTTSAQQLAAQIRVGNSMLHAIDGKTERTFTTPCGDLIADGTPYLPLIKEEFVAIKAAFGGVVPDIYQLDPHMVVVASPTNVSGKELIALVKQAAAQGTMMNFTFHGIGGDHLSISTQAHEELLQYLADHKDIYWTDTFINIMKYVKAQQRARATAD